MQEVWQAPRVFRRSGKKCFREGRAQFFLHRVAHGRQAPPFFDAPRRAGLERGGKAHHAGDVFRARAHTAFLPSAEDEGAQGHAVCRPQQTHLLGAAELCRRDGEQIGMKRRDVHA